MEVASVPWTASGCGAAFAVKSSSSYLQVQPTLASVPAATAADDTAPVAVTAMVEQAPPTPAASTVPPPVEMRALGQRIREPFYSQLTAIVYELDRRRIRTNKTEVLEYLLAKLPTDEPGLEQLASQISDFRAKHPRSI